MAIVLFASSNCCLRWSICTFMNPSSLVVPASTPVLIPVVPVAFRGRLGVTRVLDPLESFP